MVKAFRRRTFLFFLRFFFVSFFFFFCFFFCSSLIVRELAAKRAIFGEARRGPRDALFYQYFFYPFVFIFFIRIYIYVYVFCSQDDAVGGKKNDKADVKAVTRHTRHDRETLTRSRAVCGYSLLLSLWAVLYVCVSYVRRPMGMKMQQGVFGSETLGSLSVYDTVCDCIVDFGRRDSRRSQRHLLDFRESAEWRG